MSNRLARETSPYLNQHAENPVDWHAWGPEALALARAEDRPILLSIGYSACHWCHVMAHESFEDPATAALMNSLFLNIKVDREERPDLDDVYQHAIQLLGRQGGWPLTVFLTPAGVPFFGGTYFPNEDRHGLPAFSKLLHGIADAYRTRRAEIETSGRQILQALSSLAEPPTPGLATPADFATAIGRLLSRVDERHGGFGRQPKFPNTMALEALLRAASTGRADAAQAVRRSLEAMADGGIHDQLGGGFHRYSVDEAWAVPHFEKMLYDNALLACLYLSAHQWSGEARHREVARDVLDYLGRELTHPEGGMHSSQDADSPGPDGHVEEGRFYVWTQAEIEAVVGPGDAAAVCAYLGVTQAGNFELPGENVLSRHGEAALAGDPRMPALLQQLFARREQRPRPFRDDKILAAWNGLALSALARGAQVLGDAALLERAQKLARFVFSSLLVDGALRRTWLGVAAPIPAFAEDYALLAVGFLDLYETDFQPEHLLTARTFADALLDRFYLEDLGAFAVASSDGEQLVHRPLSLYDNAVPSATSAGLEALQRLASLTGEARYRAAAAALVRAQVQALAQNPFGFGNLLCGLDRHLRGSVELIVVGAPADPGTRGLLREIHAHYLPNRVLVAFAPGAPPAGIDPSLWQGRADSPQPTVFVCQNGTCLLPATTVASLSEALGRLG